MITRIGILDGVTPAVRAWLEQLAPASRTALMTSARLIRQTAVANIRASFRRTGRNRTGGGQRGIRIRSDQSAGIQSVRIWHGSGILAAHELGSTIPAATVRPVRARVLHWTVGGQDRFARVVTRRGFTLRRRPTLTPAYQAQAQAVLTTLETEYQKVLALAPPPQQTTITP